MNIPFRVKLLTETAKAPHKNCESDLWDLFADSFSTENLQDIDGESTYNLHIYHKYLDGKVPHHNINDCLVPFARNNISSQDTCVLYPQGRILVKTGIALELPIHTESEIRRQNIDIYGRKGISEIDIYDNGWQYNIRENDNIIKYAVADLRPRSGLALKHGITVLNTPGTIDNSYRKEIGVILYNAGHEPYKINKGDKICQMLVRPLYPSSFEIVKDFEDTGRGGYGSTGK